MKKFLPDLLNGLILLLLPLSVFSQESVVSKKVKKTKGTFYFSWGYNKDWFSKSDIHFKNIKTNDNDFTLYDVEAKDRPGFDQILNNDLTIPQYVYRIGYYSDKYKMGLEINFDHAKYVMVGNQVAHLKGTIKEKYYDTDTVITSDFLKFEHTNGANFLMLDAVKNLKIHSTKNQKFKSGFVVKAGGGIVIPKTDVTYDNKRVDNRFHIAGYIFGLESGFRLEMFKYFYLEPTVKGSFANYMNVLTVGDGKAKHHFWTFEAIFTAGIQCRL